MFEQKRNDRAGEAYRSLQEGNDTKDAADASPTLECFHMQTRARQEKRYKVDTSNEEATSADVPVRAFASTTIPPPTHTHKKPIPKKDASDDMHASPPAPDAITRTTGVPSAHTATRSHFQLGRQDVGPTAGPTHRPRKAQHGGVWLRPQAMTAKAEGHPLAMEGHHCKKVVEAPLLPSCRGRSSLSRSAPPT
jgi:hypothetical protein